MRIAVVSPHSTAHLVDKAGWVAEGFRAIGHDVVRAHNIQGLREVDQDCQLVVFDQYDCALDPPTVYEISKTKRAAWFQYWRDLIDYLPDVPLEKQIKGRDLLPMMRAMDLCLVKERNRIADYKQIGITAQWFDQACPSDMPHVKHEKDPRWDVLIFGSSCDRPHRRDDAAFLAREGFKVAWAGTPSSDGLPADVEPVVWTHPYALPALASHAACVLCVDHRVDVDGFVSDRVYLAAGMGACLVRRYSPGAVELPSFTYRNQVELYQMVARLKKDRKERKAVGEAARKEVMRNHTYEVRAKQIVEIYNNGGGENPDTLPLATSTEAQRGRLARSVVEGGGGR